MPAGKGYGLLGPQLMGLGAGLLSQGYTELPQTGFEGLGRGFGLAQQFGNQAQQRLQAQQQMDATLAQRKISNQNAASRLKIAQTNASRGTALERNLRAGGLVPGTPDYMDAILKGTNKSINITMKGEQKGSEALNKLTSEDFVTAQGRASAAYARESENAVVSQMLNNPDLYTGAGGDLVQNFKEIGQAVGMDVRGVAAGEVMQVLGKRAAIRLQEELPLGKLSDGDRKFLESLPPNLTKSPEANRRLMLINSRNDQLIIEKSKIWQQHMRANNSVDPKVYEAISRLEGKAFKEISAHIKELRAIGSQLAPRSPTAGTPISRMSVKQINMADLTKMTLQQMKQMKARRDQLRGGR